MKKNEKMNNKSSSTQFRFREILYTLNIDKWKQIHDIQYD